MMHVLPPPCPPLRVSVVTETYPPEIGGAALCVGHFVEALVGRGHDVEVVRPAQLRDMPGPGAGASSVLTPPLPIPLHPGLQLGRPAGALLRRLWRARRPDVVHVATEGPLGLSAVRAALSLGLPLSTSFHTNFHSFSGYYGLGALRRLGLAYLRWFHNQAACTMVPTAQTRDRLQAAAFRGLAVVPRGVDTRLFNPAKRRDELRRSWGAELDDLVVVHVGRLAPEKNVPLVIEAFDAMHAVAPRSRLVLVGDGPERSSLERRRPDLIYAGLRRGEDLAAHYASGDVFLFPSLTETFGNVTLEAMASGLAVVAYDDAAAHEHVSHLASGLLAPPGRADAFMAAAVGLARDPSLVLRLRKRAVRAVSSVSWDSVGQRFEELLATVARGRGHRSPRPDAASPGAATPTTGCRA